MTSPFIARLRATAKLDGAELDALAALLSDGVHVAAGRTPVVEGDRPERLHILADGWAARQKVLRDGRRHLSAILVPGDLCDVDGLHLAAYDYGVVTLRPCTFVLADRGPLLALCERRPAIARALTWLGFVDNALLNEASASLARRSARDRLVHLLCELRRRLAAVGRALPDGYPLPVTQEALGDALGLTAVHVNRMLRDLRDDGLVAFAAGRVVAPDWRAVERAADFSPAYLHLDGMR